MNYHNITTDDMNNGEGLRTVLWLTGCNHHCKGCQNPMTWDPNDGIKFDGEAEFELMENLKKEYISGLTLSGGDPLHPDNRTDVMWLLNRMRQRMDYKNIPKKTVWLYTGYTWEEIKNLDSHAQCILNNIDVLVDGRFEEDLKDVNYPWAGSTNQRVIDVQKSLEKGEVVLYESR